MYKPPYVWKELYSAEEIDLAISNAAKWVNEKYKDTEKPPIMVCVLKGAVVFFTHLLTKIEREVEIDFTTMSSYRGTIQFTKDPKIVTNLTVNVKGRDVIIVEDILDTANTLTKLINSIKDQHPKSVSTVILLDKPDCRVKPLVPDYSCFSVKGNPFIIGFGIDATEAGRNLPYLAEYHDDYIKENDRIK